MVDVTKLISGYKKFYAHYFQSDARLFKQLVDEGQSPKTLVIACSDSRVDPSILLNTDPGDIFVIRNVANIVPPYEHDVERLHGVSAALEFAVCFLNVCNIIVLGHSGCAGIHTLLHTQFDQAHPKSFIDRWVNVALPAKQKTLALYNQASEEKRQNICEKEAVLVSLANLITFPWISSRVQDGDLTLHGWYFAMQDGTLQAFNSETERFENLPKA